MKPDRDQLIIEKHWRRLCHRYLDFVDLTPAFRQAILLILHSMRADGTLYLCGNGGSAADAEHIVGELLKGFLMERKLDQQRQASFIAVNAQDQDQVFLANRLQRGMKAVSLGSFTSLQTAIVNDQHADLIFAQPLFAMARAQDILLAISTSGNSRNVELAAKTARAIGVKVIGLTGRDGGRLRNNCDVLLAVPQVETYLVQEMQQPLYHAMCSVLEEILID